MFVTLLGIALTDWLLPAFTRQWDDRQKARELKAAVITQVAAATAAQLVETRKVSARRFYLTGNGPSESAYERLNDLWLLHSTCPDLSVSRGHRPSSPDVRGTHPDAAALSPTRVPPAKTNG